MTVDRLLPSQDAKDLVALTRDVTDKVLDPIVDAHEKAETYPEGVMAQLGTAGLMSLPQPEEWGAAGSPTRSICRCSRRSRRGGRRSRWPSACTACRRIRC